MIRINRFGLKLIACASMLADHICRAFFPVSGSVIRQSVGRIAFPLFAYMLVRGFFYTKNRRKYCFSLLLTAVISEPVYDLAFFGKVFYWKDQNVIFTLLLSLIMLILIDRCRDTPLLQLAIAAAFAFLAQSAYLDYGAAGIAVCLIFYYTTNMQPYQSGLLACFPLLIAFGSIGALLSIPVLAVYTEQYQKLSSFWKSFFYLFYPLHITIILILHCAL